MTRTSLFIMEIGVFLESGEERTTHLANVTISATVPMKLIYPTGLALVDLICLTCSLLFTNNCPTVPLEQSREDGSHISSIVFQSLLLHCLDAGFYHIYLRIYPRQDLKKTMFLFFFVAIVKMVFRSVKYSSGSIGMFASQYAIELNAANFLHQKKLLYGLLN